MRCPKCNGKTKTIDSRDRWGTKIRRRECLSCKERFSTIEKLYDETEQQRVRENANVKVMDLTNENKSEEPAKPLSYMDKLFMDSFSGYKKN